MKRMNSLLIILAIGLLAVVAQAGSKFMNYQGVLKNGNEPVTTATEFIFEIYETEIAVSNMWSETLIVTPKANGKFHIKLGKITPFGDTVFSGNERWLAVTIGGVPLSERTELGSVPFANLAHNVPDTTIGSEKIKKHAIVDSLIGLKEIGLDKIKNNAIVDSLIKNKAIGHEKIKNDAIVDSLIKDGSIKFVDIGQNGAQDGDIMKWSNSSNAWVPAADQFGDTDNDWTLINGALFTAGEWGIARGGNTLNGLVWQTHVNLGVDGVTGDITKEYIYCTVSGGLENSALDRSSTVGGGEANLAAGKYSNVPGGFGNTAYGDNSFAAGTLAKAQHSGSIVISANNARGTEIDLLDSVWTDRGEQMVLRADSGFYLTDKSGEAYSNVTGGRWLNTSTGAHLTSTGIWANNSDKNLKENFSTINGQDILRKIEQLPITQWNYKIDDDNVIHIGPMAQDFYSVFGVGYDDKSIAALDEAGIALAAIQELHKKTQKIDKLETELADLRKLVDELLERDNSDTGGRR